MNELIKVDYSTDRPTVSARELHEFLEVKTAYKDWFPRMCEYGFTEGQDFCSFLSESTGGRPAQDAQLTIDMAKELCMLQRNERGKQARQYFIQLEKDWNSPEKVMARALQIAEQKLHTLETENAQQKQLLAEYSPKASYYDVVCCRHRMHSLSAKLPRTTVNLPNGSTTCFMSWGSSITRAVCGCCIRNMHNWDIPALKPIPIAGMTGNSTVNCTPIGLRKAACLFTSF